MPSRRLPTARIRELRRELMSRRRIQELVKRVKDPENVLESARQLVFLARSSCHRAVVSHALDNWVELEHLSTKEGNEFRRLYLRDFASDYVHPGLGNMYHSLGSEAFLREMKSDPDLASAYRNLNNLVLYMHEKNVKLRVLKGLRDEAQRVYDELKRTR